MNRDPSYPDSYFYIMRNRDGKLCGGTTTCRGKIRSTPAPVWREPGDYTWARRFNSIDSAMRYIKQHDMYGVAVVDEIGEYMCCRVEKAR